MLTGLKTEADSLILMLTVDGYSTTRHKLMRATISTRIAKV
jgi:hypothetical protein